MAPSATEIIPQDAIPIHPGKADAIATVTETTQPDVSTEVKSTETVEAKPEATSVTSTKPWVQSTSVLDKYEYFDVTPVIGREFTTGNLVEWLQSPNADELLRELALTSKSH